MGQFFNGLSSLERDALRDYATEKYFEVPRETRGEMKDWVENFTEDMAKNERGRIHEITRDYHKQRNAVVQSR